MASPQIYLRLLLSLDKRNCLFVFLLSQMLLVIVLLFSKLSIDNKSMTILKTPIVMKLQVNASRPDLKLSVTEPEFRYVGQEELRDLCQSDVEPVETNPSKSYWQLITSNPKQGSPIYIRLTVRSSNDIIKAGGGELIYVKMTCKVPPATQFGKVYNFDNGTYLIEFNPSWAGATEIHVTMFLSSRAGYFVRHYDAVNFAFDCVYENTTTDELYFAHKTMGPLQSSFSEMKKSFGECRFGTKPFLESKEECGVSVPRHYWYGTCTKPDGSSCDQISWCYYNKKMSETENYFQKKRIITSANARQTIREKTKKLKKKRIVIHKSDVTTPLPSVLCSNFSYIRPQGYWLGNVYTNSLCNAQCDSIPLIKNCLKNSKLLFIGDSTLRIIVDEIRFILRDKREPLLPLMHFQEEFPNLNFSVWYTFHGLPIRTTHSLHFSTTNWTSDILDDIGSTDKLRGYDNVIFNTNHHFISVPTDMFRLKMKDISDAIDRLYKRMPTTRLVYVAANARGVCTTTLNDYKLRYYNDLARKFLEGKPNVVFLDIWEMFLGSPYDPVVHYLPDVILEELKLLCSIFRSKRDCTR